MSSALPRFREYLLHQKHITQEQLQAALYEQSIHPQKKLGNILCAKGFLEESVLLEILSQYTGFPVFPGLSHAKDNLEIQEEHNLQKHTAILFSTQEGVCHVAMLDPEDLLQKDTLQQIYQKPIVGYHIGEKGAAELLEFYAQKHNQPLKNQRLPDNNLDEDLDDLIIQALRLDASDIHFQPHATHLIIRFRIDGILRIIKECHTRVWPTLRTKIKIMAHLDVAEERKPQHGRFQQTFAGRMVDFRVSSHPTTEGENIVIRILDKKKSLLSLAQLGFSQETKAILSKSILYNHGLILFTGPTGSGKTTSLYALLAEMDCNQRNIMTLEEPVEYTLSGVRHSEITQNMSFSEGIRSLLRQDPDVLLVGEIRDEETAEMAIRASMTGHLVLSTVHTHDVCSIPHRLMNLGVSEDLLAGHLRCFVSQRLVRRLCLVCKGRCCEQCNNTGWKGRISMSECLMITDEVRLLIAQRAPMYALRPHVSLTLWDDGAAKIKAGLTTLEEVTRVLGPKA